MAYIVASLLFFSHKLGDCTRRMDDARELAYFVFLGFIALLIAPRIYRGYLTAKVQPEGRQEPLSEPAQQRLRIRGKIVWLLKDFYIAMLLFSGWIAALLGLTFSEENRGIISEVLCSDQRRCVNIATNNLGDAARLSSDHAKIVLFLVAVLTAWRLIKLVVLSGRIRQSTATLPANFADRVKLSSKRIFYVLSTLQALFLISTVLSCRQKEQEPPIPLITVPTPSRAVPAPLPTPRINIISTLPFSIYDPAPDARRDLQLKIALDSDGRAYADMPTSYVLITRNNFGRSYRGSTLLVQDTTTEEFQEAAKSAPESAAVRTVKALCHQGVPVQTFSSVEVDSSRDAVCSMVGEGSSINNASAPSSSSVVNSAQ